MFVLETVLHFYQFAENFFLGETLNFTWSGQEIANARYKIARKLLAEGGKVFNYHAIIRLLLTGQTTATV